MKNPYLTIIASLLLFAVSCTGNNGHEPEEKALKLKVDKTEIAADGKQTATFTVTYGDDDVTSKSTITNVTLGADLTTGTRQFVTTTAGSYDFTASYDSMTSDKVTITCTGDLPDNKLILVPDKTFVLPDGQDKVTFTVTLNKEDVTADAAIFNFTSGEYLEADTDGKFTFSTTSKYPNEFYAEYDDLESDRVKITSATSFYHSVTILKFTGTWCQFCYPASNALESLIDKYPDQINLMNIHVDDGLVAAMTSAYKSYYPHSSWPTVIIDGRDQLGNVTMGKYEESVKYSLNNSVATCGFVVTSAVSNGTAKVKVKMMSTTKASYNLVVAVMENDITGYPQQTPNTTMKDYVHHNVLRMTGHPFAQGEELGELEAMTEINKEFTFDIRRYEAENCYILVYGLKPSGNKLHINNSVVCPINGSVDYRFE